MTGVEFLEEAMEIYPDARRALLTAYSDTDAAIRLCSLANETERFAISISLSE
jgi:thioredoxin reductase (NADPH)